MARHPQKIDHRVQSNAIFVAMEFPGAPEDPETVSFIDPVWLQQWGLGPENALDYFALSPFYDKSCNNEQCRMQGVDPREGLKNLTGLE